MFWSRRRTAWPIDPSKVTFGTVVERDGGNLSRTHVQVRFAGDARPRTLPLGSFVERCEAALRAGRSLDVEQLLVAPLLKRRHAEFFDRLTDWGPAAQRARRRPLAGAHP